MLKKVPVTIKPQSPVVKTRHTNNGLQDQSILLQVLLPNWQDWENHLAHMPFTSNPRAIYSLLILSRSPQYCLCQCGKAAGGVNVWGPDKIWQLFYHVQYVSPWQVANFPKMTEQIMLIPNLNIFPDPSKGCNIKAMDRLQSYSTEK